MKKYFSFEVSGDKCLHAILAWWLIQIATSIGFSALQAPFLHAVTSNSGLAPLFAIFYLLLLFNTFIIYIFVIVFLKQFIPYLKLPGVQLSFDGKIGELLKISAMGLALTFVTGGFYLPWFLRNQRRYLASCSWLNGEEVSFQGKPAKLLVSLILIALVFSVPALICFGLGSVLLLILPSFYFAKPLFIANILLFVFLLVLFAIAIEIAILRWAIQFGSGNSVLFWKGKLGAATFFYIGQLALLIITLGIAWPFVMINSWHYWISRMEIKQNGVTAFRFGFVKDFHYFKMFWTQAILCIVTVGIYLPWAFAKIAGRMVELCYVEEVITEATTPAPMPEYQI